MRACFSLAACTDSGADTNTPDLSENESDISESEPPDSGIGTPDGDESTPESEDGKMLVVYFSMPDNKDNSSVEIDGETLGNTQYMAYVIEENTGADIFRIVPEVPYICSAPTGGL